MFQTLGQMSLVGTFLLISASTIGISILALFLVRRYIPLDFRYRDNPVIGNISSLIGIIYGVLVGITALYLINNISYVDQAVQLEANAVSDIYHDSNWLKEPAKTKIQTEIKNYLNLVINVEWPLMKIGEKIDDAGMRIISRISDALRAYGHPQGEDALIIPNVLQDIKTLYDQRSQRIHMSFSALSPEVWLVILIGTILTIGINYLFGMNFYFHLIVISAAALMASSMIFLLVTLDKPFQGEFVIESDTFKVILDRMEHDAADER